MKKQTSSGLFCLLGRSTAFLGGVSLLTACSPGKLKAQESASSLTPVAWPTNPLELPSPGAHRLTVLSPTVLELELVTRKEPDPAPVGVWDFATAMPAASDFEVLAGGRKIEVQSVGFKRRPIYAPLKKRDLRLGNWLYLQLAQPLPEGARVEVRDREGKVFPAGAKFAAGFQASRVSPVLHVSDQGFEPEWPKVAFAGYYLGSLGELPLGEGAFALLDSSGKKVFEGNLRRRADQGWASKPYQQVMEADFSAFKTPGLYRLSVPGLGVSRPFRIAPGAAALLTRTYALGLYNQRSGMDIGLPFSRHVSGADHTAPAEVPTNEFAAVNRSLSNMSKSKPSKFTAPQLVNVQSALFPFIKSGKIDVAGGHRDAGDYSVYTTNSARLISQLCFAADAFPGAAGLDNLGLPESGDSKSDLLQIAKWEADYLLKMQDDDGGVFFLKYPRDRAYEGDVLPEAGDPQVVFPKNTASTAIAVACLAQMASSPTFKKQFPEAAAKYAASAQRGWKFIEDAVAKYGRDGAYQRVSHYGDAFGHDDELISAAVEMFLLTGDQQIQRTWLTGFDPTAKSTRLWDWWRMFEAYGMAIRSYAFAPQTGRIKESAMNAQLLRACRDEVLVGANDKLERAKASAYGTSFPLESKRYNSAGWYFSSENTFDLAAGYALEPRPEYLKAILENFGFEWGANPQNVDFITGVGETRQRDMVNQYAQNDRRVLPPSGLPLGNIVGAFAYLDLYKKELGTLVFPSDGDPKTPYAQMDRWSDSFNVTAEFATPVQAAALGGAALLMGQSTLKSQPWRTSQARITGAPAQLVAGQSVTLGLEVPGLDVKQAQVVWEARGLEPQEGQQFTYKSTYPGPLWVEAEALWPDGRRVAAAVEFPITPTSDGKPAVKTADTLALLDFNAPSLTEIAPSKIQTMGTPKLSSYNVAWMEKPTGKALQFPDPKSTVEVPLGQLPNNFKLSGRFYLERVIVGIYGGGVMALGTADPNQLILGLGIKKYPSPFLPEVRVGDEVVVSSAELEKLIVPERWYHFDFTLRGDRASVQLDGKTIYEGAVKNPARLRTRLADARIQMGRVGGWVDDVMVTALPEGNG